MSAIADWIIIHSSILKLLCKLMNASDLFLLQQIVLNEIASEIALKQGNCIFRIFYEITQFGQFERVVNRSGEISKGKFEVNVDCDFILKKIIFSMHNAIDIEKRNYIPFALLFIVIVIKKNILNSVEKIQNKQNFKCTRYLRNRNMTSSTWQSEIRLPIVYYH